MKRALYVLSLLLLISWIIAIFIARAGMITHVFLIMAGIFAIQAIIICPVQKTAQSSEMQH